ncbi:MAG TPA: HNH endonuclease signature motif containing protein [Polyangiaceae bacterium]|nr:HNH endonuclease signature motif containing protein [Polyangiaceae bacterium]
MSRPEAVRARTRATVARWRARHPDERRAAGRRYAAGRADADRARVSAAFKGPWAALVARARWRCVYCGAAAPLQVDHVVPIARGGSPAIGNAAPACGSCNASKRAALWPTEWQPLNPVGPPNYAILLERLAFAARAGDEPAG